MATFIIFHEVKDGKNWARAWRKGPGGRHEMFAQYGFKARTFRDPENDHNAGLIVEVPDIKKWQQVMELPETKKAMAEDGLQVNTMRILSEFTP